MNLRGRHHSPIYRSSPVSTFHVVSYREDHNVGVTIPVQAASDPNVIQQRHCRVGGNRNMVGISSTGPHVCYLSPHEPWAPGLPLWEIQRT